jgi:hypothetical protein
VSLVSRLVGDSGREGSCVADTGWEAGIVASRLGSTTADPAATTDIRLDLAEDDVVRVSSAAAPVFEVAVVDTVR